MVEHLTQTIISLLTLIALALPAIALLMGVMVEVYQRGSRSGYPDSRASNEPDFALAQYSLITFLFAALTLIVNLGFQNGLLLHLGMILISLALLFLAIGVLFMTRPTVKMTIRRMKDHVTTVYELYKRE